MKKCGHCGTLKPRTEFGRQSGRKDGLRSQCKECLRAMSAVYRASKLEIRREQSRAWRLANPEKQKAACDRWKAENPEKVREIYKTWVTKNPGKIKSYAAKRARSPAYRISTAIKAGISKGIRKGTKDRRKWESLVGYTLVELREHLEKQFKPGMSWDNYGEWHIDHKVPLSAHNYETPDDIDFKKAWALGNLQPLWAVDNMAKHDKLLKPFQPSLALAVPANDNAPANSRKRRKGIA